MGVGFSVPARCCTLVLVTAPLSADEDLPLPADTWVTDADAWVSDERAPTNPPHEPSVFNDLSSRVMGFFSPLSADRKIFSTVLGGFTLQILSAGVSFYWPFF